MAVQPALDPQEALVCTMVLVAAADGGVTDREVETMTMLVQTLPVFGAFSVERLTVATDAAVRLLDEADGLNHAASLIRAALPQRLRETAYALACEVLASDREVGQDSLRMLQFLVSELDLDPLVAAAIERGVRVRQRTG